MYYVIFISLAFGLFFFFRANTNHFALRYAQRNMDGTAVATVVSRSIKRGISQTTTGNRDRVQGIDIAFNYTVDGTQYQQHELLTYSFLDAKKLDTLSTSTLPFYVSVKYDKAHPSIASVSLED